MGESPANDLFDRAFSVHKSGDLQAAYTLYGDVLAENPIHGPSLHMSGMLAYQQGDLPTALERVELALNVGHDSPVVLNHYGYLLTSAGCIERAVEALRAGADRAPKDGELLYNLGLAEKVLAEKDGTGLEFAIGSLMAASDYLPTVPNVHLALALCLHGAGQIEAAIAAYRKVLALNPFCEAAAMSLDALTAAMGSTKESGPMNGPLSNANRQSLD